MLLETGLHRGLNFFNTADFPLDFFTGVAVDQRDMGATTGRIPRGGHILECTVGNKPKHHCIFDIDMRSKCPGQADTIHRVHIQLIHKQSNTRIKSRFRQLNCPHIVLRDQDPDLPLVQDVGKGSAVGNDPR